MSEPFEVYWMRIHFTDEQESFQLCGHYGWLDIIFVTVYFCIYEKDINN